MPTGDPLTSRPPQARWDLKLAAWLHAVGLQHLQAPLEPAEVELVDRAVRWADGVDRLEVEPPSSPPTGTMTRVHPLSGEGLDRQQGSATRSVEAVVRHLLEGESDPRRSLLRLWRIAPDAAFAGPAHPPSNPSRCGLATSPRSTPPPRRHPLGTSASRIRLRRLPEPRSGPRRKLRAAGRLPGTGAGLHRRSSQHLGSLGRFAPRGPAVLGGHATDLRSLRPGQPAGPRPPRRPCRRSLARRVRHRPRRPGTVSLARDSFRRTSALRRDAAQPIPRSGAHRHRPGPPREIHQAPRRWLTQRCKRGWAKLLAASPLSAPPDSPAHQQIDDQLADFPEVHPLILPWGPEGVRLRSGGVQRPEDLWPSSTPMTIHPRVPRGSPRPGSRRRLRHSSTSPRAP